MNFDQKSYDAARLQQQSAKGNLYHKHNPQYNRDRMRLHRQRLHEQGLPLNYADFLDESRNPITVSSNNLIIAGDWHLPFLDIDLAETLLIEKDEQSIDTIIIPGDFWDCDNYTHYIRLTHMESFQQELMEVAAMLEMLTNEFKNIYFCRGNHEKRWIDINGGKMGMKELFYTTGVTSGYKVTMDDHIFLHHAGEKWLVCHPKNFRQANLSVAKDLAAKFLCNVFAAHGHQWAQGRDRSGKFRVLDGGGMFDKNMLEYLRETTCYPETRGGFYIFQDGIIYPQEGK